jgi:hypothetical protein
MMMPLISRRHRLAMLLAGGALLTTACGNDEAAEPLAVELPEESAPGEADAATMAGDDDGDLYLIEEPGSAQTRPARIYYDLTRFEWYARGQPLVHEGRTYQPAGAPLPVRDITLELAGEYGGVDYYRMPGDDRDVVYVPVYEWYWLRFVAADEPRS